MFTRNGKPIVYLCQQRNAIARREVELLARNPDEVAIKGIAAGSVVTLAEPSSADNETTLR